MSGAASSRKVVLALGTLLAAAVAVTLWAARSRDDAADLPVDGGATRTATDGRAARPGAARPRMDRSRADRVVPGPQAQAMTVFGTTNAAVMVQEGRAARLEVRGARLHIPADVAPPGTLVRLNMTPAGQSGFPADEHPDREPLSDLFTVSAPEEVFLNGAVDLVIDLPADRPSARGVGSAIYNSRTGKWFVASADLAPEADILVSSRRRLWEHHSVMAMTGAPQRETGYSLSACTSSSRAGLGCA